MAMSSSKWSNPTRVNDATSNLNYKKIKDIENMDEREKYAFGNYGYGKNHVKLLHVHRQGSLHKIREYEIDVYLRLSTQNDYLEGDNRQIIATDSQKNTVYVLAKKHGIKSPEEFGLLLCSHFLNTYKHVVEVGVKLEEYPWERLRAEGQAHNHAFVYSPSAIRLAQIVHKRNEIAQISGGLKNLRILKTTQSAFKDFIEDGYRTLPDANDRIFSTVVSSTWDYSTANGVDFDDVWCAIKDCVLDKFAGDPEKGIFSPSVQNTLYLAEKMILDNVPQISRIEMQMPNKHYFPVNMSKFPQEIVDGHDNNEVYLPVDKPSGIIYAELHRKNFVSKL
ncbi:PREDICTED: uricase [Nicrophorus vespilloides]|uniref:Uricase n=1 Tax=Nicrophorus vespilloides TaxID=110193 RepID=A0ABM1MYS8_NICVS|nr:PREDICTED: uricase [Nicrophorus vespilloides]